MSTQAKGFWDDAEIISSYTRAQAIEDGTLVDMTQEPFGQMAKEAGIKFPIAMTATAFGKYVELTPAAQRACNDIKGRWWDVCVMFVCEVRRQRNPPNTILFEFRCVVDRVRPSVCHLKAVIGPGDAGEPVLTFMLPNED